MNSRDLWFFISITFFIGVVSYAAYSLLTSPDDVFPVLQDARHFLY